MLARLSKTMPADESSWAFEVKWDGVRAIAHSEPGRIHFVTRNGNDVTAAYPELRALNRVFGPRTSALLDGEIVAFDEQGKPSFQALQPRMHVRGEERGQAARGGVARHVRDLRPAVARRPLADGAAVRRAPQAPCRARASNGEHWRVPAHHAGAGSALLAATREQGLEAPKQRALSSWPQEWRTPLAAKLASEAWAVPELQASRQLAVAAGARAPVAQLQPLFLRNRSQNISGPGDV